MTWLNVPDYVSKTLTSCPFSQGAYPVTFEIHATTSASSSSEYFAFILSCTSLENPYPLGRLAIMLISTLFKYYLQTKILRFACKTKTPFRFLCVVLGNGIHMLCELPATQG